MNNLKKDLSKELLLYGVTDSSWLGNRKLVDLVDAAIKNGVTIIQYREKNISREDFAIEAKTIYDVCRKYNVPFIINDRVYDEVLEFADGVHIGQDDISIEEARKLIGKDKILGVSVSNLEQALEAQALGADYLGVGAVFNTGTKLDATNVSLDELKKISKEVEIPVVAIGGINKKNVSVLRGSGIVGVALVSAIFALEDMKDVKELYQIVKENIYNES